MRCRSCGKECVDVGFGHCRECAFGNPVSTDKGNLLETDDTEKEDK